ncbi:hypothetical protein UM93_11290 [Psychromicrobium lacuslunae]|uniref:Uncharacterized protein n=1 Tax=Psychromicrobium lacuslunae TaxID=1618207 RepID=A0A0D4C0K5_9MICC|nr:hypothetical protein UM93_11290 [Psychromicrobium lacuslunae]
MLAVPLGLGVWIGLTLLSDYWNWATSAGQIFAWEMAFFLAVLIWPLSVRSISRQFWHQKHRFAAVTLGNRNESTPRIRLTIGQRLVRLVVLLLGGVLLLLLVGPQEITVGMLQGLKFVSFGSASLWSALKIAGYLVMAILLVPVLLISDRMLRKLPAGNPRRHQLEIRLNWYTAATAGWVVSLLLGFIFSWLILSTL